MSSDASCEESSVREGAGYNEAFGSSDESEDFSPLSKRGTSARSPDGDEGYTEGGKDEVEEGRGEDKGDGGDINVDGDDINVDGDDSDGDDSDGDEGPSEGASEGPGDNRPFILPEDWAVNKFSPRMSDKVFRELRTHYQIPDHIPIRLP